MTKNKLEKLFSASCRANKSLWYMKLHNNPLAHQNTPADYILSYEELCTLGGGNQYKRIKIALVECKQVTCKNGKGRLAFKRLKQMHSLLSFHAKRIGFHEAYFCIGFHDKGWMNGEIYIIPIHAMSDVIERSYKKSINRDEMMMTFSNYKLNVDKGIIQLPKRWISLE